MKRHKEYTVTRTGVGYCGEHYCGGHYYHQVLCECGKELFKGECSSNEKYRELHEKHRVAVALGEE